MTQGDRRPSLFGRRKEKLNTLFEDVRLNILASGWLNDAQGLVVAFCGRQAGEGVSTITSGVAQAYAAATGKATLEIIAKPAIAMDDEAAVKTETIHVGETDCTLVERTNGSADCLFIASHNVQNQRAGAEDRMAWNDFLTRKRQEYDLILVDAGSFRTDGPHFWSSIADKTILVVREITARREALANFRRELDRAAITIDGFIVNDRRYPIPDAIYKMLS